MDELFLFALKVAAVVTLSLFLFHRGYKINPPFIFSGLMLYTGLNQNSSVLFLETFPIYITESNTYSLDIGAYLRHSFCFLTMISFCFLISYVGFKKVHEYGTRPYDKVAEQRILYLLIIIMAIQYLNLGLSKEIPLFSKVATRWNYWEEYAGIKIVGKLFGTLMAFYPLPLSLLIYKKVKYSKLLFLMYLLFLLMTGQRINGFVWLVCIMFGVYGLHKMENLKAIFKFSHVLVFAVIFSGLVFFYISSMGESGLARATGGGILFFMYRIFVLNGHVYWNFDYLNLMQANEYTGNGFMALYNGSETIRKTLGGSLGLGFIEKGINFTGGYPGLSIYLFGYPLTLVFSAVYGLLCGLVNLLCYCVYKYKLYYVSLFTGYLWLWTYGFISNASLSRLFNIPYLCILLMITVSILMKIKSDHSKNGNIENSI